MKKTLIMMMAAVAVMSSCGNKQKSAAESAEATDSLAADSTVECVEGKVLGERCSMNVLSIATSAGDTLTFGLEACKDRNEYVGSTIDGATALVTYQNGTEENAVKEALSVVIISQLVGAWVEPNPIKEGEFQGVDLKADKTASSINMHTLTYKGWSLDGTNIVLNSVSEGSGAPTESLDTFKIATLSEDSLILNKENLTLRYGRQK